MAGLRHPQLVEAYRRLHARGETTSSLAEKVRTSRAYVSRVLENYERHGGTWERIKALLTPEEVALLEAVPARARQQTAPRANTYAYPTLRAAVAALAAGGEGARSGKREVRGRRPDNPTARAFRHWREKIA